MAISLGLTDTELSLHRDIWAHVEEAQEATRLWIEALANDGFDHFEWHGDTLVWFTKDGTAIW